ncbi:hypothetical protein DSO57_1024702 [Entomophthora muscae]|uniref:Uncharacterized protein n=1 Tax=Entomophthora muscae TaxID=34485 RepID=A0ACC2SFF7_9FUNG|nr:hypothetical protein DSO57_1024702 [Entomophthora muscae]
MRNLGSFKEQLKIPFPDYKKATTSNLAEFKGKTMEKDISKKTATGLTPVANGLYNNQTCYKCGQLSHLPQYCKQPKANVCHIGPDDRKEDNNPTEDNKEKDEEE